MVMVEEEYPRLELDTASKELDTASKELDTASKEEGNLSPG